MTQLALEIDTLQLRKLEPLEDLHDKSMQNPKIAEMQSEIERLHFVIEDKRSRLDALKKLDPASSDKQFLIHELERTLSSLEKENSPVSSLVISAHDGGGYFSGSLCQTDYTELRKLAESKPAFKENLRSAYLLACYTATTKEVRQWKATFPKIELVAGYDQSAPLRDSSKGWKYIEGTMIAEHKITTTKDLQKLNLLANQVDGMNSSGGAFASFPKCEGPGQKREFYRGKLNGYKVTEFDIKSCTAALPAFEKNFAIYSQYTNGEKEIPNNKSRSELREVYSFYRNHEICYEAGIGAGPKGDEVLFLLFHENVKANFKKFIAHDVELLDKEIKALDLNTLPKDSAEIARFNSMTAAFDRLKKVDSLSMAELRRLSRDLSETCSDTGASAFAGRGIRASLSYLQHSLNDWLIARECLPFSWHEAPGTNPVERPHCKE